TEEAKKFRDRMLVSLKETGVSEGEELFYPVLWDRLYSFIDYIDDDDTIFCYDWERLSNTQDVYRNEFEVSYRTARQNLPVLPPSYMLLDFGTLMGQHERHLRFCSLPSSDKAETEGTDETGTDSTSPATFRMHSQPAENYLGNINYFKEQLEQKQKDHWHVYVFADNPNQALRLQEVVRQYITPEDTSLYPVQVLSQPLTEGFCISDEKLLVIQENEIFGRKKHTPKSLRKVRSEAINTFVDLHTGDYVVHANYGIGLFKGIERIKAAGTERDYIKLEYADEESIFVPIEQVNMVQRYIGNENSTPKLDKIGSKSWNARKARAQQKAQEIAEKLIDLYSKRQSSRGFSFPKDTEWQAAFEAAFPYEDTADQYSATEEIKADMERPVPMDRLVCGDVGYGKTEIAMRAAFKAVMGGKQVAFLAPTTILSEQHYENAVERFKNFPVKIAQLSRFISPADQKKTLGLLAEGKIDILIGTHRILQKDVIYKDLGLLIIDEEQRFGVKDKEKLKVMKNNVDCLAMSATPIPRTLHMSLLKIRDISLLATPPQNRQAIETSVEAYSEEKIAAAIRNEVSRGGQVFFLHNKVEELPHIEIILKRLVPDARICTAHGQMESRQLEDRMLGFIRGDYDILLCTTIIENGLDIPNANTIIINQAQNIGLSDLHQLRGRVGRSNRKAFCYLIVPPLASVTEDARRRLRAIEEFSDLGSGFNIAMQDLDIRGAGNLLGAEQSGFMMDMGYETFQKVINEAMDELGIETGVRVNKSREKFISDCTIETDQEALIPDEYIDVLAEKIRIYKQLDSMDSEKDLDRLSMHLTDRFGRIPQPVANLFTVVKIRNLGTRLGFEKIIIKNGMCICWFISLENSPYFKSDVFEKILATVSSGTTPFVLKQTDRKLKLVAHGLDGLQGAWALLNKLV
ncbi:MAG: transcription-repair coupling factor, partial [Treponema sp.]|nr:transcription-repair coupling factor [Treponema sp.]